MSFHQQHQAISNPRWLNDLKLALATLYSLKHDNSHNHDGVHNSNMSHPISRFSSQQQAHDFLIHVQSRNVRRKINSLRQRQQSKQQQSMVTPASDSVSSPPVVLEMGSSWLACLYILCQEPSITATTANDRQNASTERLFCAQTLLQRLRRTKFVEAVDWELEQDHDLDEDQAIFLYQNCDYLVHLVPTYLHWIRDIHPFLSAVVDTYTINPNLALQPHEEERAKGELSLLTLAATAYMTASSDLSGGRSASSSPLLSALGAVMATLALRICYSTNTQHSGSQSTGSTGTGGQPPQRPPPIVTLVTHSLAVVWKMATTSQHANHLAFGAALHACLSAIPDTILGAGSAGGGARGRLSMDPSYVQAATQEIRTVGLSLLWETIQQHQQIIRQEEDQLLFDLWTLHTCHQWSKSLPLPSEFVPLINKYIASESNQHQQAALACVIAVCEGGAWTLDEVLTSSLGLSDQQIAHQQPNKKRQTSRSKKRQKDLVESSTTDSILAQAQAEVHLRGQVACLTTFMVWNGLDASVRQALAFANTDPNAQVEGEGPIGCLAASANACLPHIIRNPTTAHARDLFMAIVNTFQELCQSPNKAVHGLTLEPLHTLHSAVLTTVHTTTTPLDESFENLIVDHFLKCSMGLAVSCAYPSGYFDDLSATSDEQLEIERNDVRDLLRVVAGSGETGSTYDSHSSSGPISIALKVLTSLLQACEHSVFASRERHHIFDETVIHAFSALARPLNHLAKSIAPGTAGGSAEILMLAVRVLQFANEDLISSFNKQSFSPAALIPRSRIANIATASLAPMLAVLCTNVETHATIARAVDVCVQAAAMSVAHLPELAAESVVGRHQYDVRGAMRGPGGEDHVGCLALMRMAFESDNLARLVVNSSPQIIPRLCGLYRELKMIELGRGQGIMHGRGVTPKSRRILLNVLCHAELLTDGQAGASIVLNELFSSAVATIASFRNQSPLDEQAFFRICEATFDLGSFSPRIVRSLFTTEVDSNGLEATACLEVLTSACIEGYQRLSTTDEPDGISIQWNRMRAALFYLLKIAADPDMSQRSAEMIVALVQTECEAIHRQSTIFQDEIVSADSVPSGVFVRVVSEVIESSARLGLTLESLQACVTTLNASKNFVLSSILLSCSDPCTGTFADPRPTLAEAWFYAMISIVTVASRGQMDTTVKDLLIDTVIGVVTLLFYPVLGKTKKERASAPGLCLDGPQSLALTEFLAQFFGLGPDLLEKVAVRLVEQVPTDFGTDERHSHDSRIRGVAIIGAALFRASQGALPPWAVESIPEVYSSLYIALGRDPVTFGRMLQLSMGVRLSSTAQTRLGSLRPGELLSGRFFESISQNARGKFLEQAVDLCRKDDISSWRQLKVLIKQACGGKKKETDYGQKPAQTRWEFDRI